MPTLLLWEISRHAAILLGLDRATGSLCNCFSVSDCDDCTRNCNWVLQLVHLNTSNLCFCVRNVDVFLFVLSKHLVTVCLLYSLAAMPRLLLTEENKRELLQYSDREK